MKLAIVGVTGMVGGTILKVLDDFNVELEEFYPIASEKSVGKAISFRGKEYKILSLLEAIDKEIDVAIFSAGKTVSLEWAPKYASKGVYVVDNSSAWRMSADIKLIVPEVNISLLNPEDKIIANPNCSTIQLAVVLWPLHELYGIKRVVVSTYQSVTGSGFKGSNQLMEEENGQSSANPAYPHQIYHNCIPQGGAFLNNLYCEEEDKLINETRKILNLSELAITATVVRVPVLGGHSESVNIEFYEKPNLEEINEILAESMGIVLQDAPFENLYPMPLAVKDRNETFVGRIRYDNSNDNAINLWVVADNLRKGAATNAVQIAQYIVDNFID
ncbi:MAG: aspartate-semialdehyde dehydrogenase [Bacteroidales bacterium]|nr:aspartate-semialdehyde dehydrogenase [Bacteroidales bacterium]